MAEDRAFQLETNLGICRKLARLRAQLLEPTPGAGAGAGTGFDVSKSGDARIALVGFPSVGKVGRPNSRLVPSESL